MHILPVYCPYIYTYAQLIVIEIGFINCYTLLAWTGAGMNV